MKKDEEEESGDSADQLTQLIHTFCQGAIMERTKREEMPDDVLYMSYADIMARSELLSTVFLILLSEYEYNRYDT